VKVIRPHQKEAPLKIKRPARTSPGMPAALIRFAFFALLVAAIALLWLIAPR